MQSNQHLLHQCKVITNDVWKNVTTMLKKKMKPTVIIHKLNEISLKYNIERKNIIKNFLNYLVQHHPEYINSKFLDFVEYITHIQECKTDHLLQYFVLRMITLL
jgi:hypothetical protein